MDAPIIDVGGGASTLVDDLLAAGYSSLTVLELSSAAVKAAQSRLGERAHRVAWKVDDVTVAELPECGFEVWHDRAVFHFFTGQTERNAYVRAAQRAIKPGGFIIMATFAEDGPTQCSGLPVVRYGEVSLQRELGDQFDLVEHERESHQTPFGTNQEFFYAVFRRRAS
ncbi:class I SAM-dependent methyltransferase [Pseudorhodoferax soli]|uniref:class I SAM-dependent methyltransferase n=1 Tax=Pseudorhodoferax soli TaxID=545864 RepID=UPI000DF22067|nr:class I SAM-dependent methyltransferase [Pseudorhodoferax soli]